MVGCCCACCCWRCCCVATATCVHACPCASTQPPPRAPSCVPRGLCRHAPGASTAARRLEGSPRVRVHFTACASCVRAHRYPCPLCLLATKQPAAPVHRLRHPRELEQGSRRGTFCGAGRSWLVGTIGEADCAHLCPVCQARAVISQGTIPTLRSLVAKWQQLLDTCAREVYRTSNGDQGRGSSVDAAPPEWVLQALFHGDRDKAVAVDDALAVAAREYAAATANRTNSRRGPHTAPRIDRRLSAAKRRMLAIQVRHPEQLCPLPGHTTPRRPFSRSDT